MQSFNSALPLRFSILKLILYFSILHKFPTFHIHFFETRHIKNRRFKKRPLANIPEELEFQRRVDENCTRRGAMRCEPLKYDTVCNLRDSPSRQIARPPVPAGAPARSLAGCMFCLLARSRTRLWSEIGKARRPPCFGLDPQNSNDERTHNANINKNKWANRQTQVCSMEVCSETKIHFFSDYSLIS